MPIYSLRFYRLEGSLPFCSCKLHLGTIKDIYWHPGIGQQLLPAVGGGTWKMQCSAEASWQGSSLSDQATFQNTPLPSCLQPWWRPQPGSEERPGHYLFILFLYIVFTYDSKYCTLCPIIHFPFVHLCIKTQVCMYNVNVYTFTHIHIIHIMYNIYL